MAHVICVRTQVQGAMSGAEEPAAEAGPGSSENMQQPQHNDTYFDTTPLALPDYAASTAALDMAASGIAAQTAEHDPGPSSMSRADAALLHVGGGVYAHAERDDLSAEDGRMDPALLAERRGQQLKLERRAREVQTCSYTRHAAASGNSTKHQHDVLCVCSAVVRGLQLCASDKRAQQHLTPHAQPDDQQLAVTRPSHWH